MSPDPLIQSATGVTVLVTGAAGFIGSHTTLGLLEAGWTVVGVDNLYNAKLETIRRVQQMAGRGFPFYEVDLQNRDALARTFQQHSIGAVIHLAGFKSLVGSGQEPLECYLSNLVGTANLCAVMAAAGCRRLIFASSAAVYGRSASSRTRESTPCRPHTPYGKTKWMVEQMLEDVSAAGPKWGIAILRYFNIVGAHPTGLLGERSLKSVPSVFASIAPTLVSKRSKFGVCGNDYSTADGSVIRDYVHVMDVVDANLRALNASGQRTGVSIHNVGTERGHSVFEVIRTFEKVLNRKIRFHVVDRRPADTAECVNGSSKLRSELKWEPSRTLEEMCQDSWTWTQRELDAVGGE